MQRWVVSRSVSGVELDWTQMHVGLGLYIYMPVYYQLGLAFYVGQQGDTKMK